MQHKQSKSKSFQASTMDTKIRFRQNQEVNVLDHKGIEKWINDILMEADLDKKSLKQYQLDRKSLRVNYQENKSLGLLQDEITRVYRCLFVYTFGFYEMLHDMTNNHQATTQIWKVFAILLQYTSKSDFQFTINVIQQEHKYVVNQLHESLIEKQELVSKLELEQSQYQEQIRNDIKHLQEQKECLLQQKEEIEFENKQVNNAFEDEVAMRVRFEFKINEIHGVYREQQIKFKKTLQELNKLKIVHEKTCSELNKKTKQLDDQSGINQQKEMDIANLQSTIDNLMSKLDQKEKYIKEFEKQKQQIQKSQITEMSSYKNQEHQLNGCRLQLQEYQSQNVNNLQIIEQNRKEILDLKTKFTDTLNELQDVKEDLFKNQNDSFRKTLQIEQLQKIETGLRLSVQTLQEDNRKLSEDNSKLFEKHKRLEVDLQFMEQKADVCLSEIIMLNQNIQQMKNVKIMLDEDFIKERMRAQSLQNSILNKDDVIQDLEKCLSYSQQRLHTLTLELTDLENRQRLAHEEYKTQEQSQQKKIDFLQQCLENERQQLINEKDKFQSLTITSDTLRKEFTELRNQYKVVIFENNNLLTKQIFLQRVIDNERQHNTDLINEITNLKMELENLSREFKSLEARYTESNEQQSKERQFLIKRYEQKLKDYKAQMKELCFKMEYEDLLSSTVNLNSKLTEAKIQNSRLLKQNATVLQQQQEYDQKVNILNSKIVSLQNELKQSEMGLEINLQKYNQTEFLLNQFTQKSISQTSEIEQQNKTIIGLKQDIVKITEESTELQAENLKQKQQIRRYRQNAMAGQQQDLGNDDATQRKQNVNQNSNQIVNINVNSPQKQQQQQQQEQVLFRRSNTKKLSYKSQKEKETSNDQQFKHKDSNFSQQKSQQYDLLQQNKTQEVPSVNQTQQIKQPNVLFTKKLNSLKIKDDLLDLSQNIEVNTVSNTRRQVMEEVNKSRSISQRSRQGDGAQSIIKRTDARQFGRLYQIASQHYQQ